MSPIEHYFENLLTMSSDIKGEPNKNALSKEVQEAIEICADYIKYTQLNKKEILDDSNADMIAMLTELQSEIAKLPAHVVSNKGSIIHMEIAPSAEDVYKIIQKKINAIEGKKYSLPSKLQSNNNSTVYIA